MAQTVTILPSFGESVPVLLGSAAWGEKTVFTVIASPGAEAELLLFEKGEEEPFARLPFPDTGWGSMRRLVLTGLDRKKSEYCLLLNGKEQADPAGRILLGRPPFGERAADQPDALTDDGLYHGHPERGRAEGREDAVRPEPEKRAHSPLRSGFLFDGYDWQGDALPHTPWNETILYQLNVRSFTMLDPEASSPGTFRALAGRIPYLTDLGVTALELQPVYDFTENDGTGPVNGWGYTDGYFFAPKSAYADPTDPAPADVQMKDLMRACHAAGLEVILQVFFPAGTLPEQVTEVLRFWAVEYHVDGFRLMGEFVSRAVMADPVLAGRKLIADGWDDGAREPCCAANDAGFTRTMRAFLRGDEDQLGAVRDHLMNTGAVPPVNRMAEYGGFTLKDLVSYETKHNEANGEGNRDGEWYNYSDNQGVEGETEDETIRRTRLTQEENALLFVFLSQGVPLLQAGDESGHTKGGNNNSWCQDNEISWLSWNPEGEDEALLAFTKELIAFRKGHISFHQKEALKGSDYRALGMPDVSFHGEHPWLAQYENFRRQLGILYNGAYGPDDSFYCLFNFHRSPRAFNLPKAPGGGTWCVKLDTADGVWQADGKEPPVTSDPFELAARTVVILVERAVPQPSGKKKTGKGAKGGKKAGSAKRSSARAAAKAGQ